MKKRSLNLPNGLPVGRISCKDGLKVFERQVTKKHILRMYDAWTTGQELLNQLIDEDVDCVRYVTSNGAYQVMIDDFLSKAQCLPDFAEGETQYALARKEWKFIPKNSREQPLFEELGVSYGIK